MGKESFNPVREKAENRDKRPKNPFVKLFNQVLEAGGDLNEFGKMLNEKLKDEKYDAKLVLDTIKEVFEEKKQKLGVVDLKDFIGRFGQGMVKLWQTKLTALGFDLGANGVDGKLGPKTQTAINLYINGGRPESKEKNKRVVEREHAHEHQHEHSQINTRKLTSRPQLAKTVEAIYSQRKVFYTLDNVLTSFGATNNKIIDQNRVMVEKHIINVDPITGDKPKFLGLALNGGINAQCYIFLKIAEEKIRNRGERYVPAAKDIGGYCFREMKIINGKKSGIPSFHAGGLAIDIDASNNGPKDGRGDIPDSVALALVESGFTWGLYGRKESRYLGIDPMHFQLDVPADSEEGQRIIQSSATGRQYYEAFRGLVERGRMA